MKVKKTQILVNLVGGLLLFWAVFQAFYFTKYGYETSFAYYLNIAGPALFSLLLLAQAIKNFVEKDFKKFSLYLILAVVTAYIFAPYVL
ncbi:hypothetical protein V6B33_01290 [Mangrovibacillus sp. Mu-81]|uniref:hypothetical protein n=1 Tax=Mangrovibacillus sp. Mu-81 TaxID=3121478 RepID=UPI002FE4CCA0